MISSTEFKSRRQKVLDYLKDLSDKDGQQYKFALSSGAQKVFSNDVKYPFRVDSDFYYLTGFIEPDSVMVLDPHADNPFTLFVHPYDPLHAIWEGRREGLSGAKKNFHADAVYEIDDFKNHDNSSNKDVLDFIHALRSVKSSAELELMRKSAAIAVQAHQVAKEAITTGIYEYEIEAIFNQVFRSQGGSGWSYPAIVASGINSCTLHYTENTRKFEKGDLVLIDAGAEYQYYASDITRVHCVDIPMSREQQDIYDVVVEANKKCIESIKPGASFMDTHQVALNVIGEGLASLKYIKDKNDPEQIKKYYMHGTGHSLGMDVHDLGIDKKTTKYVPGMVTTVEPGIYIADKAIGVRIEDDVAITKDGFEVLTGTLAK